MSVGQNWSKAATGNTQASSSTMHAGCQHTVAYTILHQHVHSYLNIGIVARQRTVHCNRHIRTRHVCSWWCECAVCLRLSP
jgi:hypothetical protein